MAGRVVLENVVATGSESKFNFSERCKVFVGRAFDCQIRIPDNDQHQTISRYHCLLDIDPPRIRIQDFGSLNGTVVNGKEIGRRDTDSPEVTPTNQSELELADGDIISLAATSFRVSVTVWARCSGCGMIETVTPGEAEHFQCAHCADGPAATVRGEVVAPVFQSTLPYLRRCTSCSSPIGDVGIEATDTLCAKCKTEPTVVIERLLKYAADGVPELSAMRSLQLVRELGRGGMGVVYLARHRRNGRKIALKIMLPEVAGDEEKVAFFVRELQNTQALKHAHVVRCLGGGNSHGCFFCLLEFCTHGSLDRLLERSGGVLSIKQSLNITRQILSGLNHAHHADIPYVKLSDGRIATGQGLVHRDLKPQNVLLTKSKSGLVVRVADFGLSKAFDLAGLSGMTTTSCTAGTPAFMPRQQVRDFRYAKPDVDVWAAAATLYNLLTGCTPRDFSRTENPFLTVLQNRAVPIRARDGSLPARLASLIDAALDDSKESLTFADANAFRKELEACL